MKKHLNKITALVLAVVMIFSFAACGSSKSPDDVLATVNDVSITRGQVEGFTSIYTYMMGYESSEITDEQLSLILEDYINIEVVRQTYENNGKNIFPDSYEENLAAFIESAHTDGAEFIEKNGVNDDHLADFFEAQYVTNAILSDIMEENPEDELYDEAEKYYNENIDYFKDEEGKTSPLEEYLEDIYYILYQNLYQKKVEELKADFTIDIK